MKKQFLIIILGAILMGCSAEKTHKTEDKEYNLALLKQYRAAKELDGVGIMIKRLSTNEKTIMKAKRIDIGGLKDLFYLPLFVEND